MEVDQYTYTMYVYTTRICSLWKGGASARFRDVDDMLMTMMYSSYDVIWCSLSDINAAFYAAKQLVDSNWHCMLHIQ